jgi:2-methylcitrate dehydratase PrpD
MNVTEKIARFIVETDLGKMPPEVVTFTKRAMIDTFGVALAGSVHPLGKAITALVRRFGCKPVARVIGSTVLTSSPLAALANGTVSHVLDYDDVGAGTQGHPSAVLMSVVISLCEESTSSIKEIIEAYVLGIEIWSKIASIMPMMRLKGWHPTSVIGAIGAATAAAKLMKLSVKQTTMALGIVASEAGGLVRNLGTPTKALHAGNAARSGIIAALLAKSGFTAAKDILGGDAGFPATFYGKGIDCTPQIAKDLGKPFALISPGLTVKKYPSCFGTHRALDAILHLIDLYDIKPERVEAVDCLVDPERHKVLFYNNPKTTLEAKFSMQFAMAAAIFAGKFGVAQDNDDTVNNAMVRSLMKRITCRVHSDWVGKKDNPYTRPDKVVVRLKNGKEHSHDVLRAKGDPEIPLTEEELLTKFRECARLVLEEQEVERCIEIVWKLEKLQNVKELTDILFSRSRLTRR